jgi:hemoglobin
VYDEIGGAPALAVVVEGLYRRVADDPALRDWFEGVDLARLKAHQRALLTVALVGTGEEYGGRMMHGAHAGLAVTDEAFDRFLEHLAAALDAAGVAPPTAASIVAMVGPVRADVVQPAVPAVR